MCCCQQYFASHSHTLYFIFTNFNSYLVITHLVRLSSSKGQLRGDIWLKITGNRGIPISEWHTTVNHTVFH